MDITASTITVVSSACTLVISVRQLVRNIRRRDESAQELEHKVETLATVLEEIRDAYGSDDAFPSPSSERRIRHTVTREIVRCENDLTRFKDQLEGILTARNWFMATFREQVAAPALAGIEHSVEGHLRVLELLLTLLQGYRINQIHQMLLTNNPPTILPTRTNIQEQAADSASILSEVTTLLETEEAEDKRRGEAKANGMLLLQAVKNGDNDTFDSLLLQSNTSLKECDGNKRNPLLLAAHFGKGGMVKKLLTIYTDNKQNAEPVFNPSWQIDSDAQRETVDDRLIDLRQTDRLGRTALHYCAEFDMCEAATILLDHGVDVDAQDNGNLSPLYYAAKNRKYNAAELLIRRGASTDFSLPKPTSSEIERLFKRSSDAQRLNSPSSPGPSRHSSVSAPPRMRVSLSMRRFSTR